MLSGCRPQNGDITGMAAQNEIIPVSGSIKKASSFSGRTLTHQFNSYHSKTNDTKPVKAKAASPP